MSACLECCAGTLIWLEMIQLQLRQKGTNWPICQESLRGQSWGSGRMPGPDGPLLCFPLCHVIPGRPSQVGHACCQDPRLPGHQPVPPAERESPFLTSLSPTGLAGHCHPVVAPSGGPRPREAGQTGGGGRGCATRGQRAALALGYSPRLSREILSAGRRAGTPRVTRAWSLGPGDAWPWLQIVNQLIGNDGSCRLGLTQTRSLVFSSSLVSVSLSLSAWERQGPPWGQRAQDSGFWVHPQKSRGVGAPHIRCVWDCVLAWGQRGRSPSLPAALPTGALFPVHRLRGVHAAALQHAGGHRGRGSLQHLPPPGARSSDGGLHKAQRLGGTAGEVCAGGLGAGQPQVWSGPEDAEMGVAELVLRIQGPPPWAREASPPGRDVTHSLSWLACGAPGALALLPTSSALLGRPFLPAEPRSDRAGVIPGCSVLSLH